MPPRRRTPRRSLTRAWRLRSPMVERRRSLDAAARAGDVIRRCIEIRRDASGRRRSAAVAAGRRQTPRPRRSNATLRPAGRHRHEARRRTRAAVCRGSAVERDPAAGNRAGDPHVRRLVAGGQHARTGERVGAAEALQRRCGLGCRGEGQVDLRVAGQVAPLGGIVQQRREVEPFDVDLAFRAQVGRAQIGGHLATGIPGLRPHVEIEREAVDRPVGLHVEGGSERIPLERRHDAPDFRQRRRAGRCHLDDRRAAGTT